MSHPGTESGEKAGIMRYLMSCVYVITKSRTRNNKYDLTWLLLKPGVRANNLHLEYQT